MSLNNFFTVFWRVLQVWQAAEHYKTLTFFIWKVKNVKIGLVNQV